MEHVPGYRQLGIRQDPAKRPFVALTGLFLDKKQLGNAPGTDQDRWKLMWERAQATWPSKKHCPFSTDLASRSDHDLRIANKMRDDPV
jgi:hypothetical protein